MGHAQSTPETPSETTSGQNEQPSQRIKDGIIESIYQLWRSGEHTNFVVTVRGTEFKCHNVILCACSGYIARQQRIEGAASRMRATFDSFSCQTFETILEMLYTGRNNVTDENIVPVWIASHKLEISFLIQECEDFLLNHLTVTNFGELHQHAVFVDSSRILQAIYDMIEKHLDVFKESQAFLKLAYDELLKIVNSQNLAVSSEDIVIDAILKWVEFAPTRGLDDEEIMNRTIYLGNLFAASRLSLASPDCLAMLMRHQIVSNHRDAKTAVDRATVYQLHVGQRHGQWPSSALHRKCSQFENVAIAGNADGNISVLSLPDYQECWQIKPCPAFSACYISVAVFNNTLYALISQLSQCIIHANQTPSDGRSHMQNSANYQMSFSQLYVLKELGWQKVTDVPGVEHILVPHGGSIYFFNPITKKVLKLDLPYNGETPVSLHDVPSTGTIVSAVPFERTILVFCQMPESAIEVTTVHCLNTGTRAWSRLNNLRGLAQLISFKNDTDTFILQKSGAVHQIINTHGDLVYLKFVEDLWDIQRELCGAVLFGKTLCVCGSQLDGDFDARQLVYTKGGVFESIKYIYGNFTFFLPVILQKRINLN